MKEHDKLKYICDNIGYKIKKPFRISGGQDGNGIFIIRDNNLADVREIIFTKEFMDNFTKYRFNSSYGQQSNYDLLNIWEHLDNPVDFLYNLINQ